MTAQPADDYWGSRIVGALHILDQGRVPIVRRESPAWGPGRAPIYDDMLLEVGLNILAGEAALPNTSQPSLFDAPRHREAMGYGDVPLGRPGHTGYGTQPRARRTDPGTSHAAAASVTGIKPTQAHILALIHEFGGETGLTDEEIAAYHTRMVDGGEMPPCSPSGLRTRRKELVDRGLLRDSGARRSNGAGRSVVVWAESR